jgi:hypothetical protein
MIKSYRKYEKVKVVYRISVGKNIPPGSPGYRQGDYTNVKITEGCGSDSASSRMGSSNGHL